MASLHINQIEKKFAPSKTGQQAPFALGPIDLTIREGEFFSLLGPSGCGKTTLLKLVAGLTEADAGNILFGDNDLTKVAPEARRFSMIFQQPLLFPHMTIEENAAFGLKMQKIGKKERLLEARRMLAMTGLSGFEHRYPDELSGGQQQRVALARALVAKPRLLLMDEPFSALDPGLREEMRELLGTIQHELGVTVLFVTHDRQEAFELSDRIGIMSGGQLLQVGTPVDLYERPESTTVASFLGLKNIVEGTVHSRNFESHDGQISINTGQELADGRYCLIFRPETLMPATFGNQATGPSIQFTGKVSKLKFNQGTYQALVQAGDEMLECMVTRDQAENMEVGQLINIFVKQSDLQFVEY